MFFKLFILALTLPFSVSIPQFLTTTTTTTIFDSTISRYSLAPNSCATNNCICTCESYMCECSCETQQLLQQQFLV